VGNVKIMKAMFRCSRFNSDISRWSIGPDTDVNGMFDK